MQFAILKLKLIVLSSKKERSSYEVAALLTSLSVLRDPFKDLVLERPIRGAVNKGVVAYYNRLYSRLYSIESAFRFARSIRPY